MTTAVQVVANRRNAQLSTGPTTDDGKAVVAHNAVKHGLLARLPVLPGVERQEDWDDHFEQMIVSLQPVGYLEQTLAERVALLMWRLGRLARYERETAAIQLENAEADQANIERLTLRCRNPKPLAEEAAADIQTSKRRLEVLKKLSESENDEAVYPGDAATVVRAAAKVVGVDTDDPSVYPCGSDKFPNNDNLDSVRWTTGYLRRAVESIADNAKVDRQEMLDYLAKHFRTQLHRKEDELKAVQRELDQHRRQRLVPKEDELNKITRYEAHLDRCLYRTLHEFQRLQAARVHGDVPAPVAIDVTIDCAGEAA